MSKKLTLEDLDQSGAVMFIGGRIVGKQMFLRIMAEMRQYKTIEKEVGIDLITFIKVVEAISKKEYIWTKYNCQSYFPDIEDTNDVVLGDEFNGLMFIYFYWDNGKHLVLEIKDYGKTWALTKEELQ